jgi:starch synthase
MGLDAPCGRRATGSWILNGLDTTVWDPAADADWPRIFSDDRTGKAACRADLLTRIGFDAADTRPVIGMIGRLDPQKGFDLLADARRRCSSAVCGSWSRQRPPERRPVPGDRQPIRQVAFIERFDRVMARKIYPAPTSSRCRAEPRPGSMIAPLRDPTDRASDRRTRRHGHRRGDP